MTESKNRLISDCSVTEVTELVLVKLRSMPEDQAAIVLDGRLRGLEDQYKRSFTERGIIMLEIQERQLWRWLATWDGAQYHSFEQYICAAAPHSRSECFAAMRAVKELRDIPREQLSEIPRCNVEVLRTLSSGIRAQAEVLDAAKALPEKEFREKILADFPEQHIEGKRRLVLTFAAGDYDLVCSVLDEIGSRIDVHDREGELLALAIDWQQEHSGEREGVQ